MFCSLRPPLGLRRSACVATHIDIGSVFDSMVSLNRNSYLPHEHVKLEDFGSIVGGSFHFYLFPDPSLFFFPGVDVLFPMACTMASPSAAYLSQPKA